MNTIFFDTNGHLRSGWRAFVFLFVFLLLSGILVVVEETVVSLVPLDQETASIVFTLVNGAGLLAVALAVAYGCGRLFERLPFRALGAAFTKGWSKHLAVGIILGAGALVAAVLITYAGNGERFQINAAFSIGSVLTSLAVFSVAAAWEEAFFRGYPLQTFARSGLAWLAIVLTSAFFGIVHLANPNATAISTLNTVLAGVIFSLAYLKTRDLWFPWGIHLMWNWTQGSVFGIEVSGITAMSGTPVLTEIDAGPKWLTGGDYGLEGSIACTIVLLGLAMLISFLPNLMPDEDVLHLNQAGS